MEVDMALQVTGHLHTYSGISPLVPTEPTGGLLPTGPVHVP